MSDQSGRTLTPEDFDGDLVATRVAPKVIVNEAPERIKISLALMGGNSGEGMWVAHDLLHIGTPDSVTYRVVGWDGVSACLLATKETAPARKQADEMDRRKWALRLAADALEREIANDPLTKESSDV